MPHAKTSSKTHRYMLVDGNALVHRGFHAVPNLMSKTGEHTGAVYGFTMILLRAIKDLKPTHIACTFDLAGPTFRHDDFEGYKATRVKAAPELYEQFPRVKEVVASLHIPIFEQAGFEADDVLGTLAKQLYDREGSGAEIMIVTGDMDTLQLVNEVTTVHTLRKGLTDTAVYDIAAIKERYGFAPRQMIDYKALRGDPSDNIPGVPGIGEKTALELIAKFGTIVELFKIIDEQPEQALAKMKPRTFELLTKGRESAFMSSHLATIVQDVPLEAVIPPYQFTGDDLQKTMQLFSELEFKSLLDKLPKTYAPLQKQQALAASEATGEIETATAPVQAVDIGPQNYECIDTAAKLDKLMVKLSKQKLVVIDTETTGLDPITDTVIGVSLAWEAGTAYYIPWSVAGEHPDFVAWLSGDTKKVGHNIKFDYLLLKNTGVTLGGVYADTMIASYLLNPGTRGHGLDGLAFNELGYQMQPIEDLIGKGKKQIAMTEVPLEKLSWYAAEDADMTLRLWQLFEPRLAEAKLESIFHDIEMPLITVLATMERTGITVDVKLLQKLSAEAAATITRLEQKIYDLVGHEFNINSPKQLQEILFGELKIEPFGSKKTKTGISTAAGELEKLRGQHPIIDVILEYREITKLQSTYLLALPELVKSQTGRIHTSYNQTIAATGRLSSIDPNLQNIPVRGEGLGAEVRKAFVPAEGFELLAFDYSQIELRIVAHLAQDEAMMSVFQNHEDIHTGTAMRVFGVEAKDVTPDMRRDAKTINFGILYGLSSFGLSSRIGEMTNADAKQFIEKYFAAYPKVYQYLERVKAEVHEHGFVTNEIGRIRKFPEIASSQYFIRAAAERAAINFPIQSLEADIVKLAMLRVAKAITGHESDIRMLLQVHDELVFEVKAGQKDKWMKTIFPLMDEAYKLTVPVEVEAKAGPSWGEMEKLKLG